MAVFDATTLLLFLEPDAKTPLDPATNEPVTNAKCRIDHLIETLEKRRETIVIPTPALSEVLVHANDAGAGYLENLNTSRCFRIEPFDQRAAVELATMTREAQQEGNLRAGTQATRAKLKFDRQIIAIARTQDETTRVPGHSVGLEHLVPEHTIFERRSVIVVRYFCLNFPEWFTDRQSLEAVVAQQFPVPGFQHVASLFQSDGHMQRVSGVQAGVPAQIQRALRDQSVNDSESHVIVFEEIRDSLLMFDWDRCRCPFRTDGFRHCQWRNYEFNAVLLCFLQNLNAGRGVGLLIVEYRNLSTTLRHRRLRFTEQSLLLWIWQVG